VWRKQVVAGSTAAHNVEGCSSLKPRNSPRKGLIVEVETRPRRTDGDAVGAATPGIVHHQAWRIMRGNGERRVGRRPSGVEESRGRVAGDKDACRRKGTSAPVRNADGRGRGGAAPATSGPCTRETRTRRRASAAAVIVRTSMSTVVVH
jgi:hypothetical protein